MPTNIWFRQFAIAHVVVHIYSDVLALQKDIGLLTQLYPSNQQKKTDLTFHMRQEKHQYLLCLHDEIIWQSEDARDIAPAFEFTLYQRVLQLLTPALISLHAASISSAQHTIMFAGRSGAGKSSLCTAALLDGADYITDEFSLLSQHGDIHPFPRPLQWDDIHHPAFEVSSLLDSGLFSKGAFSFPSPQGSLLTSHLWLPQRVQHQSSQVHSIILPQYHADAPPAALTPIRRSQALMLLTEHLHTRASFTKMFQQLNQRLPQQVNFYQLDFSDVFKAWASVKHRCCMPEIS